MKTKFYPPLVILFVSCLIMTLSSKAQSSSSQIQRADFFSDTLQRTYQYQVYLPAGYDDLTMSYPVIYLLHGRGDTMDAWLNIRSALDELIESGGIPSLIAIMPDMTSNDRASYYIDSQYTGNLYRVEAVETAFFDDLIPYIDKTYQTIPTRDGRLIGGYSMGGYGAIRYSLAHSNMFVGAIVLSPAVYTPLPPADSSTREFGAFGIDNQLFDEGIYQTLNYPALLEQLDFADTPLHIFIAVGDDEWKNPKYEDHLHDIDIESHLFFNQAVRTPNISAEFRVYNGGHDWIVWERGFVEGIQYLMQVMD